MAKFSVMTWNIWLKENPDNIVSFVKQENPDIICCQEVIKHPSETIHRAEYIAQKLGYHYSYAKGDSWDSRPEKSELGNAIFSRFPILETKRNFLKNPIHNPQKAYLEGRSYIEVVIEIDGNIFSIANTHLSYTPAFEENDIKIGEFQELLPFIQDRKNYILCGDFNSSVNTKIISEIGYYLQNAGPDFSQNTWTTKPFQYDDFSETECNWRLDHIFASRDIEIMDTKILQTDFSDHLPIKTLFSV